MSSFKMMGKEDKYNANDIKPGLDKAKTHIIGLKNSKSIQAEKVADQKLWIRLKIGSEEAFKELFLKYNNILTKYGRSIVYDPCVVEDCIHDLFLYIWSKRDTLCEVDSVKYYLIVCFRRKIFKVLSEKEKENKLLQGIRFEYPKYENFFEKKFITDQNALERKKTLNQAVDTLPRRQKEVLHLRYVEGLSYQDITSEMGITNVSARKLAYKAIKNLRKNIF